MKRLLYILLILPVILVSCEESPEAGFSVNTIEPVVGQEIAFTNTSLNAVDYEWNFGDGYMSNEVNPIHIFTVTGTYQVTLKAFSKSGNSSEAYINLTVKAPTLLEVEVLEYFDHYPVENASVRLYPTLADWDAEKNLVTEGFTDADGKVLFAGLGNYVYYLDIWEKDHDNYALRAEDPNFIRTPQVKPGKITRFIAYVDYVGGKGSGERDRNRVVIRKLVPRVYVAPPAEERE